MIFPQFFLVSLNMSETSLPISSPANSVESQENMPALLQPTPVYQPNVNPFLPSMLNPLTFSFQENSNSTYPPTPLAVPTSAMNLVNGNSSLWKTLGENFDDVRIFIDVLKRKFLFI